MSFIKSKLASTGAYSKQIVDIYARKDATLPTDEHFYAFFSRFGTIFELYHHHKASRIDHVYLVYKTEDAVPRLKAYLNSSGHTGFWRKSCTVTSPIATCPVELMRKLDSNPQALHGGSTFGRKDDKQLGSSWGQPTGSRTLWSSSNSGPLGKRGRDDPPHQDSYNKKIRFTQESKAPEPLRFSDPHPASEPSQLDKGHYSTLNHANSSHSQPTKNETTTPNGTWSAKSALELAQQAAELASKPTKRDQDISANRDNLGDIEKLKAERDEAIAQRDAAIESCRRLERELQQLQTSAKEKSDKTDKILRLVTASLQSLQEIPDGAVE